MGAIKLHILESEGGYARKNPTLFLSKALEEKGKRGKNCLSYYPYGMIMHGRTYSIPNIDESSVKYGFNNMERDDEIKGKGNSYDFGARIQDPRIGRWLSTDPHENRYPNISTYSFASNNPIVIIDPDGRDIWLFHDDGSWEYQKTNSGYGERFSGVFFKVDKDGNREDIFSYRNYMLGALPWNNIPAQDLLNEFSSRPMAYAILKQQDPGMTKLLKLTKVISVIETTTAIVEAVASLPSLLKATYKGGKIIINVVRYGKVLKNGIVSSKGIIRFGNVTYESAKAFMAVSAKELDFLSYLDKLGTAVKVKTASLTKKTADFLINGKNWELKTIENISENVKDFTQNIKKAMLEGASQSKNIIADMRNLNVNLEQATIAANRALGSNEKVNQIRIVGKGFDEVITRAPKK